MILRQFHIFFLAVYVLLSISVPAYAIRCVDIFRDHRASYSELSQQGFVFEKRSHPFFTASENAKLQEQFEKNVSNRKRRIFKREFAQNFEDVSTTLIDGDVINFMQKDPDLRVFVNAVQDVSVQAQPLAPPGKKVVVSAVSIFVNRAGEKASLTGSFHQDYGGLIGFTTLFDGGKSHLTTRYVDPKKLLSNSEIPKDTRGYTHIDFNDINLWARNEDIEWTARDEIIYFYGLEGQKHYRAEALLHAGPVGMNQEHPGDRIAIGVSFEIVPFEKSN